MRFRSLRGLAALAPALLRLLSAQASANAGMAQEPAPVIIDYFYEPGCAACERVRNEVMPELRVRFEGFYKLNRYDVGIESNVVILAAYQDALSITENESVSIIVDYKHLLNGFNSIQTGLYDRIDQCVAERLDPNWQAPLPIVIDTHQTGKMDVLERRISGFTLSAVLLAGLTDGINPCAISTLVFFMSLLTVAKVRGRALILMGASFCLASFLTYMAIGFGLLRFLHLFFAFPILRGIVEWSMVLILTCFSYFSFRDAYRYRNTRDAGSISLQLPDTVKTKIHQIMHSGLRGTHLVLGGLTIGTAVTALESVCTGQVYVPTMVLVITEGGHASRAWLYLLAYNLMFVLPLVAVFTATYCGLKTHTLLAWSKRNVVASKCILGLFFLAMAILIALL